MSSKNYKNLIQEYSQKYKYSLPEYTTNVVGGSSHLPLWVSSVLINNKLFKTDTTYSSKKTAQQQVAYLAYDSLVLHNDDHSLSPVSPFWPSQNFIIDIDSDNDETQSNSNTNKIPNPQFPNNLTLNNVSNVSNVSLSRYSSLTSPQLSGYSPNNNSNTYQNNQYQQGSDSIIVAIDLENIQPIMPEKYNRSFFLFNMHFFLSCYSTVDPKKYIQYGQVHIIDSSNADASDHFMTYKIAQLTFEISTSTKVIIASRDKSSSILAQMLVTDGYNVTHVKSSTSLLKKMFES
jgi:hypothetical protein